MKAIILIALCLVVLVSAQLGGRQEGGFGGGHAHEVGHRTAATQGFSGGQGTGTGSQGSSGGVGVQGRRREHKEGFGGQAHGHGK